MNSPEIKGAISPLYVAMLEHGAQQMQAELRRCCDDLDRRDTERFIAAGKERREAQERREA